MTIKVGRKLFHLYDVSGREVIQRQKRVLQNWGYQVRVIEGKKGWYRLYSHPKVKKSGKL